MCRVVLMCVVGTVPPVEMAGFRAETGFIPPDILWAATAFGYDHSRAARGGPRLPR